MGNHGYECPTCGEQLAGLSGGHGPYCPGERPQGSELMEYHMQLETLKGGCVADASEECVPLPTLGMSKPSIGKLPSTTINSWLALSNFEHSKGIAKIIRVEKACTTLNRCFAEYVTTEQLLSYIIYLQAKSRMELQDEIAKNTSNSEDSGARFTS